MHFTNYERAIIAQLKRTNNLKSDNAVFKYLLESARSLPELKEWKYSPPKQTIQLTLLEMMEDVKP